MAGSRRLRKVQTLEPGHRHKVGQGDPCHGYTLVEALIAMVVLSTVAAAALQLEVTGRGRTAKAVEDRLLLAQAQSILDRIGLDVPLEAGQRRGTLADGSSWLVRLAPEKTSPNQRLPLLRVEVEVKPRVGNSIVLQTLRLQTATP